jgi:hypothetical protein
VSHKKGRPEEIIDGEAFEKLAAFQCTQPEIAAFFKVSVDTIQRRIASVPEYAEAWERGRENGKASLRRMQFSSAQKGNVTMQIWLGKQYLGQRDKFDTDVTMKDGDMTLEQFLATSRELLDGAKKKKK